MVSVSGLVAILVLFLFLAVAIVGVLTIRHQNRMFPKGFDRTGWHPERGHAGWFLTKFTWLGGGRGP